MTPYNDSLFFYILAAVLIPAIILGLAGKRIKLYGMGASIIMLCLIYSNSKNQAEFLLLFYIFEFAIIRGYLYLRENLNNKYIFWSFTLLGIVPLLISKFSNIFSHHPLGFLGISYLTFKAVQMIIEINDGLIKKINLLDFSYFLLFFPTISSGPIDRSRRFDKDINGDVSREQYSKLLGDGTWKLILGVGYYFIASYLISEYWLKTISHEHTLLNTINYMYAYSFYLFFDFAGYSLMAVGTSYILGVRTPDNFNLPFISRDIKDFWNRWHISLSSWFRDFVYTRFVMKSLKNSWFKSKYTASYIGYMITMGLMGIWHGTQIYYILYGLYQGLLIVLTDFFQRKSPIYKKYKKNKAWQLMSIFVTFHLVCFGFLIFSGFLFK